MTRTGRGRSRTAPELLVAGPTPRRRRILAARASAGPGPLATATRRLPSPRAVGPDATARNTFGWFSPAGFVILGALYPVDAFVTEVWPFALVWTLLVAPIAGTGAAAPYFGNDPTARRERTRT